VAKVFHRTEVVHDVSVSVAPGQFLVLLGPSGSGKTTVLRMIAGFEQPSRGTVWLRGRLANDIPPNHRDVAMVFQHLALFPHLTVEQNVVFGLEMRRVPRDAARQRASKILEMVHLGGFEQRLPRQLSGGQQQRVALARALVTEPTVLLLDEPLGSLDRHLRMELQGEIRRLQQELRITAIMVTHDQEEAMTMGDRIAVMRSGRLQQIGTPADLYQRPANAFVANFMGDANVFRVAPLDRAGGAVRLRGEGGLVFLAGDAPETPPAECDAMVRPESMKIAAAPLASPNCFRATVVALAYAGAHVRCRLRLANGMEIRSAIPQSTGTAPSVPLAAGDDVYVGWEPSAMRILL